jgi:cell division protein ZapE
MTHLEDIYTDKVAHGTLHADPVQLAALPDLQTVLDALAAPPVKRSFFGRAKARPPAPGLYMWGGVGRGKSMLMDLFHDAAPITRKRRVHFHAFMQEIQSALHEARKTGVDDAIRPVADAIIKDIDLLCFDEMQITDIADAMIVGRLFERFFAAGVVVVTTSNRPPDDLYKDGLNRALFLPFIAMLKERMKVHELASDTDYRQGRLSGEKVFFAPITSETRASVRAMFDDLTGHHAAPFTLHVKGREVLIPAFRNGIGRAGFHDLCGLPLGPADFLEVARVCRVLVLENVPRLGRSNFNQAKRFVTLIDALYEARVRLICSAAAQPDMLYIEGEGSFEFERTASRMMEMQAAGWGDAPQSDDITCTDPAA